MPRSPNAAALTKVQTTLGTEPIYIIEINWANDAIIRYADKDIFSIPGKIMAVSGLDAIAKVGSAGVSGSLNVELDDTDGSIKQILNTIDIHKRPARVYQTYEGLAEGDEFLLLSGQVSSPIEWDEGQRIVRFAITSEVEDNELGFSPEEGEFDFIADSAIGVPWPLCYGSVVRVPAVRLTESVRGTSLTRYGQITVPELERLCGLAVQLQKAETAKKIADQSAGYTISNYATIVDNFTSATIGLNTYLEGLIFDSPTQEDNLREYVDLCKELERWRVFYDQELAKLVKAEEDLAIFESYTAQGPKTINKPINSRIDRDADVKTEITFDEQDLKTFRLFGKIEEFTVTIRGALPENIGLVEQAQIAYDNHVDTYWPYSTPEEWATGAALQAILTQASIDLNDALGRQGSAESNLTLAAVNIKSVNTNKNNLEWELLEIVLDEIIVENGENFPQGIQVEIIINGMHFKGKFADRVFTIDQANTPADISVSVNLADSGNTNEFKLSDASIQLKGKYCKFGLTGITFVDNQDGNRCFISPLLYEKTGEIEFSALGTTYGHDIYEPINLNGLISETSVFLSREWMKNIKSADGYDFARGSSQLTQRDYEINIGDAVYLASDYKEIYIANLIPSLIVTEVMAYRVIDGERKLLPVPSRYFDINLNESIAGQNSTTIRFKRPLTEFYGEQWEDKIYVSLTSSRGPNAVDVISHLVDTYTDLTKDASSFASVSSSLAPFPVGFAFLDRRGTLGAIEDIAWQCRCAAYVKDGVIYLKYLALEEAALETVTESDIDRQTLIITLTPTEDLVTEFVAEWDSDYARSEEERRNKIVLRNNIPKYGTIREEYDFFVYNQRELVIRAAVFWLIRYSNTWKIARFNTPLHKLRFESLDTIALDLQNNLVASASVKGTVQTVTYDSENQRLEFEVQTSVRAGELASYVFNWPAGVDVSIEYPTDEDLAGGAATL